MKQADTIKEVRVINFPGMIARIHIPELTPDERSRRMNGIRKAAENLLKGALKNETGIS